MSRVAEALMPEIYGDLPRVDLTMRQNLGNVHSELKKGVRMRPPVKSVYDRQVARCLSDIEELYELPEMVEDRIKRAIEYTAKDIDKLNHKESGYGCTNEVSGNF